jgi:NAD(P)-dependent dehydrogenase (short-subunit alcohol dehydrogenase family)
LDQVEAIEIDVDQIASIKSAHEVVGRRTKILDVLINNARIPGKMPQTPLETDISIFMQVFETIFLVKIMCRKQGLVRGDDSGRPRLPAVILQPSALPKKPRPDFVGTVLHFHSLWRTSSPSS